MWREGPAIGIDLGTTYSCVAVYRKGRATIIANEEGNRTTASCVAFTDMERLIGDEAKTRVVLNPQNTIFDSKRMIGRKCDDPKILQDIENWQFDVLNKEGKLKVCVEFEGETELFSPEEISAMVLTEMKENAEYCLGQKVIDAVISVPACFNDSQRQATKNAARIAGLNVIRLITEPTATILAYMVQKTLKGVKNVLIYDLGGGTLDVSVITIDDDMKLEVNSTAGDSHLGGEDFDNLLVAHFVEEIKTKHQRDLRCPVALRRLRIECEYAKRTLTSSFEVRIYINCLFEGINFHSKLTRAQFEDMCMDLFRSTLKPVKRALFDAGMAKGSIDEVILVGGSSRIPKIRELIKEFFDGKEPYLPSNPEEAVAYGAAVQAAVLTGRAGEMNSFVLGDVSSHSILLETKEGVMNTLIHRNSQIPCQTSMVISTDVKNQKTIKIDVYEGERATAKDNRLLGRFRIVDVPPAPNGPSHMKVTFYLDSNGILDVRAESSKGLSVPLTTEMDGLSNCEIDEMLEEAKRLQFEENEKRNRNKASGILISYVYSAKLMVEYSSDDSLSETDRDMALELCDYFLDWMEDNSFEEPSVIIDEVNLARERLSSYISIVERARLRQKRVT